jgi:hypothetical protein
MPRKHRPNPGQIAFAFDPPGAPSGRAALAGLEQRLSQMVSSMLRGDTRPREVLAAEVSVLLDEPVSREMLDAYASPARQQHKVIMSRALALVAVTGRHDLLDPRMREIGAAVLVGEEVHTARVGHLRKQRQQIDAELRQLERQAPLIGGAANGY